MAIEVNFVVTVSVTAL